LTHKAYRSKGGNYQEVLSISFCKDQKVKRSKGILENKFLYFLGGYPLGRPESQGLLFWVKFFCDKGLFAEKFTFAEKLGIGEMSK